MTWFSPYTHKPFLDSNLKCLSLSVRQSGRTKSKCNKGHIYVQAFLSDFRTGIVELVQTFRATNASSTPEESELGREKQFHARSFRARKKKVRPVKTI